VPKHAAVYSKLHLLKLRCVDRNTINNIHVNSLSQVDTAFDYMYFMWRTAIQLGTTETTIKGTKPEVRLRDLSETRDEGLNKV
jgi:hypothetical protein